LENFFQVRNNKTTILSTYQICASRLALRTLSRQSGMKFFWTTKAPRHKGSQRTPGVT